VTEDHHFDLEHPWRTAAATVLLSHEAVAAGKTAHDAKRGEEGMRWQSCQQQKVHGGLRDELPAQDWACIKGRRHLGVSESTLLFALCLLLAPPLPLSTCFIAFPCASPSPSPC
jgi:hypothetical protein